ncbi:MAG TPA: hypothetical protein VFV33_15380, partial [Gemmatimonadaceae bacterium]|nr:hypothetical protein [Gemmatimonadaceae bacterium]
VESERRAWALADALGLRLTTILPAGIIGPGFVRSTPTTDIIRAAQMGVFRVGAPSGTFTFVDVRDAAEAHCLALEREATGRFIVGYDHIPTFDEIARAVARLEPRVRPPLMVLPRWLSPLLPAYDAASHALLGTPRVATPEVVATGASGNVFNYSAARAKRELGWAPRVPFEESLRATLELLGNLA